MCNFENHSYLFGVDSKTTTQIVSPAHSDIFIIHTPNHNTVICQTEAYGFLNMLEIKHVDYIIHNILYILELQETITLIKVVKILPKIHL